MAERDEKRTYFIIRGKADGIDDFEDVVAAVAVKNGKGGIAADERLTAPMLSVIRERHKLPASVVGGAFALDSETFVRGDGGMDFRALCEVLGAPPDAEIVLYTHGLLKALALDLTSNRRWDL